MKYRVVRILPSTWEKKKGSDSVLGLLNCVEGRMDFFSQRPPSRLPLPIDTEPF